MTVRMRIIGGTAAVLTVLLGVALMSMWKIRALVATEDLVSHGLATRVVIYSTLSRLTEAESGVRGYLLSGNATFRASQARAERALRAQAAKLEHHVRADVRQADQMRTVAALVGRRVDVMHHSMRQRTGTLTIASDILLHGSALTDSLRTVLLAMDADIEAGLVPQASRSDLEERSAATSALAGALVASLVIVLLAVRLERDFERRKKSEALYHGVVDVLAEGVLVRDPKGRVVECNPSAERILGLSREELLSLQQGDLACFREDGTPMPVSERPGVTARSDRGAAKSEIMGVRRPNGEMRWLLVNAAPMFIEGTTRIIGVTTSFADITRRKEAEAEVREQRELLQDFLDNASDLIAITNGDGRLLYANRAYRVTLGIPDGVDIVGRPLADFLDREEHAVLGERMGRLLAGESLTDVAISLLAADGRSVPVTGDLSCRFENGMPVAFRGIMRDMTEMNAAQEQLLMAMEQASAANNAKSEFLANMSHELRTPLNSVIGFAGVLMRNKSGLLQAQELQYLQRISDNGRHLLGLINSVLDLSKVEAGRMEIDFAPVDLGGLVNDTLAQMDAQVHGRPVALRAVVPAGLQPFTTDAVKLKQVLINLVGNALKFTEHGSVTVRVIGDASHRAVAIEVVDTGIGIPIDRQAAVFEAFRQADNSTTRRFGGTGLGLTITRSICQLLGYSIGVASEPGVGSTFTVTVGAGKAVTALPAAAPAPAGDAPRVLIIDDDPDARLLLSQYVTDAGCEAVAIGTGAAGLRLAAEQQPALILLDIMMPQMNGLEVLEKLRGDADLCAIPVVIVSIVASEQRKRAIGASALIDKPVRREEIEAVLRRYTAHPVEQLGEIIKSTLAAAV